MKSSIALYSQCLFLVLFAVVFAICPVAWAEGDQGYIYGKITMDNGNVYQGVIRWGDEEAFWDDMFNSTVETRRGTFHGFIQWDHDECLGIDILDGVVEAQ